MALYQYRCPVCGWETEQFEPLALRDAVEAVCWDGTMVTLQRVITAPNIRGETVSRGPLS